MIDFQYQKIFHEDFVFNVLFSPHLFSILQNILYKWSLNIWTSLPKLLIIMLNMLIMLNQMLNQLLNKENLDLIISNNILVIFFLIELFL